MTAGNTQPKCLNCCRGNHQRCDDFLTVVHNPGLGQEPDRHRVSVTQCVCSDPSHKQAKDNKDE